MKLLFEEITGKVARYTIRDSNWFPSDKEGFFSTATADITVSRRDSQTVLLKGELAGQRLVLCDRCGEQVNEKLACHFEYLVTTRPEPAIEQLDAECCDEDVLTLYLKEPEIDIDEILREQAYLSFPMRTLCSEECKGICAGCGVVLNSETCCCSEDKSNSTFAVLKKLINS